MDDAPRSLPRCRWKTAAVAAVGLTADEQPLPEPVSWVSEVDNFDPVSTLTRRGSFRRGHKSFRRHRVGSLEASEASLLPMVLELSVSVVAEVFWLLALASFWLAGHLLPMLNKH